MTVFPMRRNAMQLTFLVEEKIHCVKQWPAVPREGEQVWIDNVRIFPDEEIFGATWCIVTKVQWIGFGDAGLDIINIFVDVVPQ